MSKLDVEETLELIMFHNNRMFDLCPNCDQPIKEDMLVRLERVRELILTLPDHVTEVVFEPEMGTMQ